MAAIATAETARLIASLELKDQFSKTVNSALGGLTKLDKRIDLTKSKAFQTGQHIGIGIQNVARIGLATVSAGAGVVAASLKVAGDFEAQLNTINTIARASPTELNAIGESVRKIARDTGTGLADLTQGYYDLLSAGVKTADATNVLTQANTLAIGGLSTTAEAVDLLTTALNVYGGGAKAATVDADIFAKTIERGKITAADLAASFSQVGSIAKSSGIELTELGAAYARLTAGGTDAAEASTQIRSAIVALTKQTVPLEKLQKQTGRNYLAIAGKQGLVAALEIMRKDATKAGVPLIDLLGRVEGLNFVLATTGPNFAAYNADLDAMGKSSGTAAAQMAERQQGLNFQLSRLRALAKDAGITIGSALLPKLTPLVARLNEFVNLNQDKIKQFGTNIAGLFSDANITAGINALKGGFEIAKDAAPAIADAARITGSALKVAVDAFKSLPGPIQSLAIAGLAVNKLTGGLVTNLAGGLISAVLKQLVSGVVNVNGAVVNVVGAGGVIPLGPGPGQPAAAGAGGLLGKAFGAVTKVVFPIAVGLAIAEGLTEVFKSALPASSTPEQQATRAASMPPSLRGSASFSDTTGFTGAVKGVGKALDDVALATTRNAQRLQDVKDADLSIAGYAKATVKALGHVETELHRDLVSLKKATDPAKIAAAAKKVAADVTKGAGSLSGTNAVLAELRKKLDNTHDPKLQAALRSAIGAVQAKLPNREFAAKQYDALNKMLRDGKLTNTELKNVAAIERSLRDRGLPHAAEVIARRVDAAKAAQVSATHAGTDVLRRKKFSSNITIPVSVTNRVTTTVNSRTVVKASTEFKKYFATVNGPVPS